MRKARPYVEKTQECLHSMSGTYLARKKLPDLNCSLNSFNNVVDKNLNWKHALPDSFAPDRKGLWREI